MFRWQIDLSKLHMEEGRNAEADRLYSVDSCGQTMNNNSFNVWSTFLFEGYSIYSGHKPIYRKNASLDDKPRHTTAA